jgi:Bacteriophage replication gene A protein (GPA)
MRTSTQTSNLPKPIVDGSRAWLSNKLYKIEKSNGKHARSIAAAMWQNETCAIDPCDTMKKIVLPTENGIELLDLLGKLPACLWENWSGTATQNLEKVKKIKDKQFFKTACELGNMTDSELIKLSNEIATKNENPELAPKLLKRLRREKRQSVEQLSHNLGMMGKGKKWIHVTPFNLRERSNQLRRIDVGIDNIDLMDRHTGEVFSLRSVVEKEKSNRAAEVFCMLKGIEKVAESQGMHWAMLTLTAGPSHHPSASTFEGGSMIQAAKEIESKLRNINKELSREKIQISGVRSLEFHKDGCPHVHICLFFHPIDEEGIKAAIEKKFTLTYRKKDHGFEGMPTANWIAGDSTKSRPSSYAMKYVMKTLFAVQGAETDQETKNLDALYSTWNLRRYSFFGIPSLTTWRLARKTKNKGAVTPANFNVISKVVNLAGNSNSADYIKTLGGLGIKNSLRPAKFTKIEHDVWREIVMHEKIDGEWNKSSFGIDKFIRIDKRSKTKPQTQNEKIVNEINGRALIESCSRSTITDLPTDEKLGVDSGKVGLGNDTEKPKTDFEWDGSGTKLPKRRSGLRLDELFRYELERHARNLAMA